MTQKEKDQLYEAIRHLKGTLDSQKLELERLTAMIKNIAAE